MTVNFETHQMPAVPGQLWAGEGEHGLYQWEGADGEIHTEVTEPDEIGIHFTIDDNEGSADASYFLTAANAMALAASLLDAVNVAARWKSQEELAARQTEAA